MKRIVAVAALGLLFVGGARAEFVSEQKAPALAAAVVVPAGDASGFRAVSFVGKRPAVTPSVGGARRFGVIDAIGQFAPAGFKVVQTDANLAGTVDWVASPDWVRTLDSVLVQSGNEAVVGWQEMRIVVKKASASEAQPVAVAPVKAVEWQVRADDQWVLASVLPRWANVAGVHLVIDRRQVSWDYQVSAPATFKGSFVDAVTDLFASIDGTTDRPVRVVLHGSGDGGAQAIEIRPLND